MAERTRHGSGTADASEPPRRGSDAQPTPEPETAAPSPELEKEQEESAAEPEAADHEAQLEHDLEELTAKAEKADEYLELAQRTKADFENYRKRAARETAAAQERGVIKLAKELLPAVDNLDRALAAVKDNGNRTDELAS